MKKATTTGAAAKSGTGSNAKPATGANPKTSGSSARPAAARISKPAPVGTAPKTVATVPAKTTATIPAPAPRKVTFDSRPSVRTASTAIVAKIDVGFGNLLYIRGDGPGLSWDRGVPLECASSDTWAWSTAAATRPFAYKVLVNDERWSNGDDFIAAVGVENSVRPEF